MQAIHTREENSLVKAFYKDSLDCPSLLAPSFLRETVSGNMRKIA